MKHIMVLVGLFVLGCSCDNPTLVDALDRQCGKNCYPGPAYLAGTGVCNFGTMVCKDDGSMECSGYVSPSVELCDNLDNDCDGKTDEAVTRVCQTVCGVGKQNCLNGIFLECSAPKPTSEVCNSKDDDCDGKIDELEDLPLEFCYNGPKETVNTGECRPGILECIMGKQICNAVTPRPEICDSKDNDCNGYVDENVGRKQFIDLVIAWDNSGSMSMNPYYQEWQAGIEDALRVSQNDIRVGVMGMTYKELDQDGKTFIFSDLQPVNTFITVFRTFIVLDGGGLEANIDVIQDINTLPFSWRPNTRKVLFMFTDEEAQSYAYPINTVRGGAQKCMDSAIEIHIWNIKDYLIQFKDINVNPINTLNDLNVSRTFILNRILSIIGSGC